MLLHCSLGCILTLLFKQALLTSSPFLKHLSKILPRSQNDLRTFSHSNLSLPNIICTQQTNYLCPKELRREFHSNTPIPAPRQFGSSRKIIVLTRTDMLAVSNLEGPKNFFDFARGTLHPVFKMT